MLCKQCSKELPKEKLIASISGSIMGDEYTDVYYFCSVCKVYSVESWRDNFTGVETSSTTGPLPQKDGDAIVARINQCSTPWDKKCRCDAHRRHFNNTLD